MKISIITVVYNNRETISDAMDSVLSQDYPGLEYIIVDGASTDGTVDCIKQIIKKHPDRCIKFMTEKDSGMYDAMNKGIAMSTGDIVGTLNSDDVYINNQVLSAVAGEFMKEDVDSVFADLVYVRGGNLNKIVRYYNSANFHPPKMAYGWMPAHPTFFVRRMIYEKYGYYKTDYRIAADYELIARFLVKNNVTYRHIPRVFVRMRMGGASTKNLKSNWILNREIIRACRENGIKTNILKVYSKYPVKILEKIFRPEK